MWDCSGESIYHFELLKNACQYLSVYLYYIHVEHWKKKKNYIYKDTLNNILVLLYLE